MIFANRIQAGRLLADALAGRAHEEPLVVALPRGGVPVAAEVAASLHAPLDLVVARKIGHPSLPEFAIAAINEEGWFAGSETAVSSLPVEWVERAKAREWLEARRRREQYAGGRPRLPARGKTVILVDDGIATGLTMRVAIREVRGREPARLVVAVPVVPRLTADLIEADADELVALVIPDDDDFLGSVGAYYEDFSAVTDEAVTRILARAAGARSEVQPAA